MMYLGTVCVPNPQHKRVVLGEELGSAAAADTQLFISKNTAISRLHGLKIHTKPELNVKID